MFWRTIRNALALVAVLALSADAQQRLTAPKDFFGHEIGADYVLPNYTKFVEYWQRLATESDRMDLDTTRSSTCSSASCARSSRMPVAVTITSKPSGAGAMCSAIPKTRRKPPKPTFSPSTRKRPVPTRSGPFFVWVAPQ